MRLIFRKIFFLCFPVVLLALFAAGCIPTSFINSPSLTNREHSQQRILLMPLDIELSILHVGGVLEPQAEWTLQAVKHVSNGLQDKMTVLDLIPISGQTAENSSLPDEEKKRHIQLVKLHGAVGNAILVHQYNEMFKLPGKEGAFDWSLGPEARFLRDRYGADYALFVFMRDSYASTGRVAVIVISAAFGVGVPGGSQIGFASLVDLKTGQIVWFNRLMRGVGDLRTEAAAQESVNALLQDFPL